MDYRDEIKQILELHGLNLREFSDLTGLSYDYVRFLMKPSEIRVVHWQRLFVYGYELGKKSVKDV